LDSRQRPSTVRDATEQAHRRRSPRIAANIAKLPELLRLIEIVSDLADQ